MRIRKRTEVTVESARVVVIRRRGGTPETWCPNCREPMRMATLGEAMLLTGATSREIHRRLEAGELHFAETPEGHLLLCLNTLRAREPRPERMAGTEEIT